MCNVNPHIHTHMQTFMSMQTSFSSFDSNCETSEHCMNKPINSKRGIKKKESKGKAVVEPEWQTEGRERERNKAVTVNRVRARDVEEKTPDITRLRWFSEARQLDRLLMQQYPSVSDSLLSFSPYPQHTHSHKHCLLPTPQTFLLLFTYPHLVYLFKTASLPISLFPARLLYCLRVFLLSPILVFLILTSSNLTFYYLLSCSPFLLFTQSKLSASQYFTAFWGSYISLLTSSSLFFLYCWLPLLLSSPHPAALPLIALSPCSSHLL